MVSAFRKPKSGYMSLAQPLHCNASQKLSSPAC